MDIVLRAAVAFGFILLLTRIVGRRNLSALEPFDLILLVMLGDLVQQGVTQSDFSVTGLALAAGTVALLAFLTAYLTFRFRRLRTVLEGEPIVILEDGRLIERNLRRQRITPEEVAEEARLQKIGTLDSVAWGVLEKTGQMSFIPK